MGGICSSSPSVIHHHHHSNVHRSLDAVVHPKDMPMFYDIFNKVDKDKNGKINVKEFLEFVELPSNSLIGRRVFSLIDDDMSSEVDFQEFANSIWDFCAFGEDQLIEFALRLVDKSGDGKIQCDEIKELLIITAKERPLQSQVKGILVELDKKRRGYVDIATWIEYVKKNPSLAFAAYNVQKRLRHFFGGEQFWLVQKSTIETKHSERLVAALSKMSEYSARRRLSKLEEHAERIFRSKQRAGLLDSLGRPVIKKHERRRKEKKRFGKRGKNHVHIHHHTKTDPKKGHVRSDGWVDSSDIPEYKLRIHTTGYK